MKKFILITLAVFFLTFGAPASAPAVVTLFDNLYTIDIPSGWAVSKRGDILTLLSSDRKAVFLITRGVSVGKHKEIITPELYKYSNIIKANPERRSTLNRIAGLRVVVTILGDHPDRTSIYYSIKEVEREKPKWRLD